MKPVKTFLKFIDFSILFDKRLKQQNRPALEIREFQNSGL